MSISAAPKSYALKTFYDGVPAFTPSIASVYMFGDRASPSV